MNQTIEEEFEVGDKKKVYLEALKEENNDAYETLMRSHVKLMDALMKLDDTVPYLGRTPEVRNFVNGYIDGANKFIVFAKNLSSRDIEFESTLEDDQTPYKSEMTGYH